VVIEGHESRVSRIDFVNLYSFCLSGLENGFNFGKTRGSLSIRLLLNDRRCWAQITREAGDKFADGLERGTFLLQEFNVVGF
jgi:hypothetical protein